MTPGKTNWNQARNFLETFVTKIKQKNESPVEINGKVIWKSDCKIYFETKDGVENDFYITVENEIITEIIIGGQEVQKLFQLQMLLSNYGAPDEIYIEAFSAANEPGPLPFYFLVYYDKNNFWAEFSVDAKKEGNIITACPQSTNPRIWIGAPNKKWETDKLFTYVFGPSIPGFPRYPILSLEEATGMEMEQFTKIFSDPQNTSCFETPADLWHKE